MPKKKACDVTDPKGCAKRIHDTRVERGLSYRELADRTCFSASYIHRVVTGQRPPTLRLLTAIAPALKVSVDYLATGKPDPTPEIIINVPGFYRQDLPYLTAFVDELVMIRQSGRRMPMSTRCMMAAANAVRATFE